MKSTHAIQISFFQDPHKRSPARILKDWWPLVVGADMVAQAGARITVIQACHEDHSMTHHGVDYHFLKPARTGASIARAPQFARLLRSLEPDILHVHGLGFARDVLALSRLAGNVPIYIQDHADRVPRIWRRPRLRRSLAAAAGVSFCAASQAEPFIRARLMGAPKTLPRIFEIPEGSSPFSAGDRELARQACGVFGDPALLWVGHLNQNKDPLTVLRGVSRILDRLPQLQVWCCYGTAPLEAAVRAVLHAEPRLAQRVHLLGRVEHTRIETLMRAADIFVLGSHHEGSGGALIEAMATGLTPVVTDIPSFRSLTGGGRIGALWPCDDAAALGRALVDVAACDRHEARRLVQEHFAAEVSPHAVGRKFLAAYRDMISAQSATQALTLAQ